MPPQSMTHLTTTIFLSIPAISCIQFSSQQVDKINPLRLFEEHIPSLLRRGFIRRNEAAKRRQKVEKEVSFTETKIEVKLSCQRFWRDWHGSKKDLCRRSKRGFRKRQSFREKSSSPPCRKRRESFLLSFSSFCCFYQTQVSLVRSMCLVVCN